ncbi:hypothetical protein N9137_00925 [Pseudomonadales bacterium]|nr:hypothetical protein [Pseudomonadales bacterium]
MNWQGINLNSDSTKQFPTEHRESSDYYFTGGKWSDWDRVNLEQITALVNYGYNQRLWVCVPTAYSDKAISRFCEEVLNRCDNPIFEYSNEVWNNQFKQHAYAQVNARPKTEYEGWFNVAHFVAQKTKLIKSVVGSRGDVVVASQFYNRDYTKAIVKFVSDSDIDALAVAPYIGRNMSAIGKATPMQLGNEIGDTVAPLVRECASLAHGANMQLWGYEGGLHIEVKGKVNRDQRVRDLGEFNRSQDAADVTLKLWDTWIENGGGLFCPYSLTSGYGAKCFGHCEVVGNQIEVRPKYNAIVEAVSKL